MGFEFGNAAMLFGTLLLGVPLIIHLLNRRRYKVKPWAAIDFLFAAYKRTRRRLRLENLILLLLRCLIIVLLALAMAKPFISSQSAVAALTAIRRDVVIVLDDSYSMGYHLTPDETCYDLAKKKINALLARLDAARGDTVTMILMGPTPEIVVPFHSPPQDALVKLERLTEPGLEGSDFSALVDLLAGEVAASITGKKEVFIFTDLQARVLGTDVSEGRASTAALLVRAVEQDMDIRFVDVGKPESSPSNVAVTDVGTLDPYVTTEGATTFFAMLENYGYTEIPDCRGRFVLDGKPLDARSVQLKPGAGASVECMVTVLEAGFHHIAFQLEPDNLLMDDVRWHSFDARHIVQVLLVDGRFNDDPLKCATGQLMWVINPARIAGREERGTIFEPEVVDYKIFNTGHIELDGFDCVMLVDVEGLSAEMAGSLLNYTRAGGSLVLFMGDTVDLAAWNQRLGSGEGAGLLPTTLRRTIGSALAEASIDYYKLTAVDAVHPLFALFNDPRYRILLEVPVFKFMEVEEPAEDVNVIARLTDSLDHTYPAVLEKPLGQGRIVFFAFSAASDWSLIPERPALFLPLMHNLLYHLTARDSGRFNMNVGDSVMRSVAEFPEKITLVDPSGFREEIADTVEERAFDRYHLPLSNHPLEEAGPYMLEVDFSLSGNRLREGYTANVDPAEGNLRRFDAAQLDTLFPDAGLEVVDSAVLDAPDFEAGGGKGEFWKPLLIALLVLLALEGILSWKFGNYR